MKLVARKTTGTADFAHPAWAIFRDANPFPLLRIDLVPGPFRWEIVALAGRYGVSHDDEDAARAIQAEVRAGFKFEDVLVVVRRVLEAQHEMHRQEALAEQETERRSEAFWENRMSDADYEQEREEWARDEWLCALEEGRR